MRFRLFGEVTAVGDTGDVGLGSGRPAAVLSLLLLDPGRVISVERLVEELWGEAASDKGIHAVRVYVSRLRSALSEAGAGEPVVVAKSGGYMADVPRSGVDILRFQDLVSAAASVEFTGDALRTLDEALGLWQADPLTGFPYDEFALRERSRLADVRLDAAEMWAEAAIEAGRTPDVVTSLAPLLREHPFREKLWASLAIALYREQRQTEALRAIHQARSALSEAGLEVGPRLTDLESSILAHDPTLSPPSDPPHNLPSQVDSFVGRGQEVLEIERTLESSRLTTLVGPGGCGKTRLAIETAWHLLDQVDGRAWLVDLAAVNSPEAVPESAIEALDLGPWSRKRPIPTLADAIGDRRALLVLDNCEHLIEAAASFAEQLVRRCPDVRVLATTREPLRIAGESVITVPSLLVPPREGASADYGSFEAVALFLDRTRKADPRFELTPDNEGSVVEIVQMLDGIPLAIELAAVRVRSLPVPEIARHLDDLFGILGVGSRTALPRHRTLEATLDWSLGLLEDDEKTLFCELGVLRAGFGVDAAMAVAGEDDRSEVEHLLAGLVEKSMIVNVGREEPRYRLLEPVRQYASRRLHDTGESHEIESRRDDFFFHLAKEAGDGVRRFEDPPWRHRFGRERPNLLTSVESLLAKGDTDRAAEMTATTARYWLELGLYDEGKRLTRSVLQARRPASHPSRLSLMIGGAWLGVHQGDYDRAEDLGSAAISLADSLGDSVAKASALNALGSLAAERGNMRLAAARMTDARQTSGPEHPTVYSPTTVNLAAISAWAGDLHLADQLIEEIEGLANASAFEQFVVALRGLTARMRGDLSGARPLLDRAISAFSERGSAFHLALWRVERALVAFEQGDMDHADRLCRVVLNRAEVGTTPLAVKMKARLLSARLAIADGFPNAGGVGILDAVLEAEATGTVGVVAEAADVAGSIASSTGDRLLACRLLSAGTALRMDLDLARDAWETRQYTEALSRLQGMEVSGSAALDPATLTRLIRSAVGPIRDSE